jgi:tetratricopeptide (TPR) repeat protein
MGDFEAAAAEFSTVLRLDRFNSSAHYGIGLVRLQQGELADAESEFLHALSLQPKAVAVQESLGQTLVREHKWNDALPVLRAVLAQNQNSIEALNALATTLERQGDKAGAAEQFKRARELSRQELSLHRTQGENNQGLVYWHAGHLEDAAAAFRRAIQMRPDYAEAHNNLGGVLWQLNDSAPALAEFQAAVRYSPSFAEAHNNWGTVLLHAGEYDYAIEQFRAALAIRPGFALAHLNLGYAMVGKHNLDSAEIEFRNAATLAPKMAAAHVELGLLVAARHGSLSRDARAELEEALRLDSGLRSSIPAEYLQKLK